MIGGGLGELEEELQWLVEVLRVVFHFEVGRVAVQDGEGEGGGGGGWGLIGGWDEVNEGAVGRWGGKV